MSLNDTDRWGQNGWADFYQDGGEATETSQTGVGGPTQKGIAAGLVGSMAGMGANIAGLPGNTASSLASQAVKGSFDVGRTSLGIAKDVASMAAPEFGGIIGAGLNAGYAGITGGPKAAAMSAARSAASFGGYALAGPLGGIAASVLGSMAVGSYNEGMIGDALNARSREVERDIAENMGYSRSQTSDGAGIDAAGNFGNSGYSGLSPGLGSSGYGLSPGLSDMSGKYGNVSLGDMSFGGYNDGGGGDSGGRGEGGGTGRGSSDNDSSPGGIGGV